MGGRVNGRMENSQIYILTYRDIDFHKLTPTAPEFVLGGDLERVALVCARLDMNLRDLELISPVDLGHYETIVKRYKERELIEAEGDSLTSYGKEVERLPVSPAWAEMLVHAQRSGNAALLHTAVIGSCVETLYSLLRRGSQIAEYVVSDSDHLTSCSLVVAALKQFGYIGKERKSNGEVIYRFQGDWSKVGRDPKTGEKVVSMGEFRKWCDEHKINAKAIREVTIAMRSVYRQLGMRLPSPEELPLIKKAMPIVGLVDNTELCRAFVELLAKVQSLDFVRFGYNSRAGQVFTADCSYALGQRVLGTIRYWTSKRSRRCSSIEGTEIPEDLVEKYVKVNPNSVGQVTDKGVELHCSATFAGESTGGAVRVMKDDEVPQSLRPAAEQAFVEAFVAGQLDGVDEILKANEKVRQASRDFWLRSGGKVSEISTMCERVHYRKVFKDQGVFSVQSCIAAIKQNRVKVDDLRLKLEDYIPVKMQKEVEQKNPKSIKIEGHICSVEYIRIPRSSLLGRDSFQARVQVTEELIRTATTKKVKLPSGQKAELVYGQLVGKTFADLRSGLEEERNRLAWEKAQSEVDGGGYVNLEAVTEQKLFDQLLAKRLIADLRDGQDEEVYGYLALRFERVYGESQVAGTPNGLWHFALVASLEEAEAITSSALEFLVRAHLGEILTVPEMEPFQKKDWLDDSWSLTSVGTKLRWDLEGLVSGAQIRPGNLLSQVEHIRTQATEIRQAASGKADDDRLAVSNAESALADLQSEISDSERPFLASQLQEIETLIARAKLERDSYSDFEEAARCADEAMGQIVQAREELAEMKKKRTTRAGAADLTALQNHFGRK